MKKWLFIIFFQAIAFASLGNHLKGGFFTYEYLGRGLNDTNKLRYTVSLTVYMHCNPSSGQQDATAPFTFFDAATNAVVANIAVDLTASYDLSRGDHPCITNETTGCIYHIRFYRLGSIELPKNSAGYTVAFQRCCRITGIVNLVAPSHTYGTTYTTRIPGTDQDATAYNNKSAKFLVNDTAIICAGSYFELPFIAFDADTADQLQFSFCDAYIGGGSGTVTTQANPPPYTPVPYAVGFAGSLPLGNDVTIDPNTGMIRGLAPSGVGEYVVTVCVTEIRNGVPIAVTRKELHVYVGNCNTADASLPASYSKCESFTYNFSNQVPPNPSIQSYSWDFGDGSTSSLQAPSHTYADTGTYLLKLVVNRNGTCSDSTTSIVRVYPGFDPGFTSSGICVNKPTQFTDLTTSVYGTVNKWDWDFGMGSPMATSIVKNPSYTYAQTGPKEVRLIVSDSKGCFDTVFKVLDILDKPPLAVAFADTLICKGDTLRLRAFGSGNFQWRPNSNMSNAQVSDPLVDPRVTTVYEVELDQNGCINSETVQVRVVDFVSLQAMPDTVICLTDSAFLRAHTNGLRYTWSPSANMNDPTRLNPKVRPTGTTTYQITSHIGNCNTTDDVVVTTVPYPSANAGKDTVICHDSPAQLNATIMASDFTWSPAASLTNAHTLSPIAKPRTTTEYIITVTDDLGCPKPGRDTVLVTVMPKIFAFAGSDTSVVVGQPLQLSAFGGVAYQWQPATSLSDPNIFNPIGLYDGSFDSIRYKILVYNETGCVDSASLRVRIFRTDPRVFVPTAFTPNGDGLNDVVRPIAAGMEKIEYFRVYNRWGQLVFSTTTNGHGWDGRVNGKEQGTDVFIWMVKARDYKGVPFTAKGTVTLVR